MNHAHSHHHAPHGGLAYHWAGEQQQERPDTPRTGITEVNSPRETAALLGGKKFLSLSAEESVYSAIVFLPSISRIKEGNERNRQAKLALLLVFLNALLQMGVVYVIKVYDHSAQLAETQQLLYPNDVTRPVGNVLDESDRKAAEAARKSRQDVHKTFLPRQERAELEAVEDIVPLCGRTGEKRDMLQCTPYSVQFVHEWHNLDFDGDGVWTVEEAKADTNRLKEKYQISPETIFNNLINGLRMSQSYLNLRAGNRTLYLTNDVMDERAIPKAYFNYWMGDAMMCNYFDSNSCEAIAADGVFEKALVPGRLSARSKGIKDLDSAIEYCYRMLNPGGGCETLLPVDFKRNREQRWNMCGTRYLVEGGKYTNPYNPDQSVHVLKAAYQTVSAYQRATSRLYLFFLILIINLWLLSLVDEWREILKFGEMVIAFPSIEPGSLGGEVVPLSTRKGKDESEDDGASYKITGFSTWHRALLVVVFLLRVLVVLILTMFGTRFLLVETSFLDLVMNSLALTFILTIDSMLYGMVEKDVTAEMERCRDIRFITRLPTGEGWRAYCLKKECWGLFLVPVVSIFVVLYHCSRYKEPVLEALTCACVQEGDNCMDAIAHTTNWWKNYWETVLPAAIHQITAMQTMGQ